MHSPAGPEAGKAVVACSPKRCRNFRHTAGRPNLPPAGLSGVIGPREVGQMPQPGRGGRRASSSDTQHATFQVHGPDQDRRIR